MLIITEKPKVAKHFAVALHAEAQEPFTYKTRDNKFIITHCRGHLLEAWEASQYDIRMKRWNVEALPVIPREIQYNVIKDSAKILRAVTKHIQEAVQRNDEIMIATDAEREGEVIARLVLAYAKAERHEKLSRFWESESTEDANTIINGIKNRKLLKQYDTLAKLGLSWKKCDWLYGINMTVLFTLLAQGGGWQKKPVIMNVGRVQTAVLYEVYRRQKEIERFVPKPYKQLEIHTEDGIRAYLVKPNDLKDTMFDDNSKYVGMAEQELQKNNIAMIKSIEQKHEITEPPLLYNTSELCKEVYRVYGFDPTKTLALMQKLYEEKGTLSYPRTPSQVLGEGNEAKVQEWLEIQLKQEPEIEGVNKEKYALANKRLFNNKRLKDHFGLVPLKYMPDDGSDEYKVFRLVQIRFLMQGMKKHNLERTTIVLEKGQYAFVGSYTNIVENGWKEYEIKKNKKDKEEHTAQVCRPLQSGMLQKITGWKLLQKKTEPPKLYDYASLLTFMQNPTNEEETEHRKLIGIGTEATRPPHIKGLEKNEFIYNKNGLLATEKGKKLLSIIEACDLLKHNIRASETTAWEILGEKNPDDLVAKTKTLVRDVVNNMKEAVMATKQERESMGQCPSCGGEIYEGEKSFYCSNWKPEEEGGKGCKAHLQKLIMGQVFDKQKARNFFTRLETDFMDGMLKEGNEVVFKLVYDEEKKDIVPSYQRSEKQEPLGKCPICGKEVFVGKKSFFCTGYKDDPKCDFMLWRSAEGTTFTPEMIKTMLVGGTLQNVSCFTKDKKEYYAGFRVDEKGDLVKITYGGQK